MRQEIVRLENQFEGHPITTVIHNGRPCWVAGEIGRALGYAKAGRRFSEKFLGEWSKEFDEGKDFTLLDGEGLADFKALFDATAPVASKANRALLLLYEEGIFGVLLKTQKPAGVRLRRWLRQEVLPQIARTGRYEAPAPPVETTSLAPVDERTLRVREKELDQEAARALDAFLDRYEGKYGPDVVHTHRAIAVELRLGRPLLQLHGPTEEEWLTPAQIAARLSPPPSVQMVGRLISGVKDRLGVDLRGQPLYSRQLLVKASNHDGLVTGFIYSPRAVEYIRGEWSVRLAAERARGGNGQGGIPGVN